MKYFTRRFIRGELPHRDHQAAIRNYRKHLKALRLPKDLAALAELHLYDARFVGVLQDKRHHEYAFDLLTGDVPKGYCLTRLCFHQASLTDATRRRLARWSRHWEVLSSELHAIRDGYSFHLLLQPRGELVIRFEIVDVSSKPINGLIATFLRAPPGLDKAIQLAIDSRSPADAVSHRPAFTV